MRLRHWAVAGTLAWLGGASSTALAGDGNYDGIAGITEDGEHIGVFLIHSGSLGLVENAENTWSQNPMLAHAWADWDPDQGYPTLPHWRWNTDSALVRSLHAFSHIYDDRSAGKLARVQLDPLTGRYRLELKSGEAWYTSKCLIEDRNPRVTGTIDLPESLLVRTHVEFNISREDDAHAMRKADIPKVRERAERARAAARVVTARVRELRASGRFPFTKKPKKGVTGWQALRHREIEAALSEWSCARAFEPLPPSDLTEVLWLAAVSVNQPNRMPYVPPPSRKFLATGYFSEHRARHPQGAEKILTELSRDPAGALLAGYLRVTHDELSGIHSAPIEKEWLKTVSDAALKRLHQREWARIGRFRFSSAEDMAYFREYNWYIPMSQKQWDKRMKQRFFTDDPDRSLKILSGWRTIKLILDEEKRRGVSPPAL